MSYAAFRRGSLRRGFFDARQRSYYACIPAQSSGLVPSASASRNAISAEIPALPLRIRESAAKAEPL